MNENNAWILFSFLTGYLTHGILLLRLRRIQRLSQSGDFEMARFPAKIRLYQQAHCVAFVVMTMPLIREFVQTKSIGILALITLVLILNTQLKRQHLQLRQQIEASFN